MSRFYIEIEAFAVDGNGNRVPFTLEVPYDSYRAKLTGNTILVEGCTADSCFKFEAPRNFGDLFKERS